MSNIRWRTTRHGFRTNILSATSFSYFVVGEIYEREGFFHACLRKVRSRKLRLFGHRREICASAFADSKKAKKYLERHLRMLGVNSID